MFKSLIVAAIFATTASFAIADPATKHDLSILPADVAARVVHLQGHGNRYDALVDAIFAEWSKPGYADHEHELDMSILSPEVAARVVQMQAHGDRFDATIRAIFIEAMKPGWGTDDCGHDLADATFDMTNS